MRKSSLGDVAWDMEEGLSTTYNSIWKETYQEEQTSY